MGNETESPDPAFSALKDAMFFFFNGALRPQKPYGLLGTGEGRKGWEIRAQALPPELGETLCSSSLMVLYVHRNRMDY